MRVLVTGASGFVGAHLVRRLAEDGHEVWAGCMRDQSSGSQTDSIRWIEFDVCEARTVAAALDSSAPEAVVHLAGLTHVGESWKRMHDYFNVNVIGTENLLRAAAGRRVVVASSAEVYGLVPETEQPIHEERPVSPQSPYALTKAAVERLALLHDAAVVRSFNLAGAGQAETFALPSFARQLAEIARGEREPVLEVGNLAAKRDFLHVEDGVSGYQVVLESGEPGIYNLGSGVAVSIGEALEMLIEVSGVEVSTRVDPERWRQVDLPVLTAECSKLRGLGWEPRRTLRQGLEEIWLSVSA